MVTWEALGESAWNDPNLNFFSTIGHVFYITQTAETSQCFLSLKLFSVGSIENRHHLGDHLVIALKITFLLFCHLSFITKHYLCGFDKSCFPKIYGILFNFFSRGHGLRWKNDSSRLRLTPGATCIHFVRRKLQRIHLVSEPQILYHPKHAMQHAFFIVIQ